MGSVFVRVITRGPPAPPRLLAAWHSWHRPARHSQRSSERCGENERGQQMDARSSHKSQSGRPAVRRSGEIRSFAALTARLSARSPDRRRRAGAYLRRPRGVRPGGGAELGDQALLYQLRGRRGRAGEHSGLTHHFERRPPPGCVCRRRSVASVRVEAFCFWAPCLRSQRLPRSDAPEGECCDVPPPSLASIDGVQTSTQARTLSLSLSASLCPSCLLLCEVSWSCRWLQPRRRLATAAALSPHAARCCFATDGARADDPLGARAHPIRSHRQSTSTKVGKRGRV